MTRDQVERLEALLRMFTTDMPPAQRHAKCAMFILENGHAIADLARSVLDAPEGECVEVGDDEEGQPRVLIHSTRDELRKGPALVFKPVRIVAAGVGES